MDSYESHARHDARAELYQAVFRRGSSVTPRVAAAKRWLTAAEVVAVVEVAEKDRDRLRRDLAQGRARRGTCNPGAVRRRWEGLVRKTSEALWRAMGTPQEGDARRAHDAAHARMDRAVQGCCRGAR